MDDRYPQDIQALRHGELGFDPPRLQPSCTMESLPADVLPHILLFLPFKEAVRTSIISKAWRNQWSRIPSIDFDDGYFQNSPESTKQRIIDAIDTSVDLRRTPFLRFRLVLSSLGKRDVSKFKKWLRRVLSEEGIRELHLDPFCRFALKFPPFFLDCEAFGSLRTVTLRKIRLLHHPIEVLLSKCPFLENLTVNACAGMMSNPKLYVGGRGDDGSLRLKSFRMQMCTQLEMVVVDAPNLWLLEFSGRQQLSINAMRLRVLRYKGRVGRLCYLRAPFLYRAVICNVEEGYIGMTDQERFCAQNMLRNLDHVKSLEVDSSVLCALTELNRGPTHMETSFFNLEMLAVSIQCYQHWEIGMCRMLELCQRTKHLTIRLKPRTDEAKAAMSAFWTAAQKRYEKSKLFLSRLMGYLNSVKIYYFEGNKAEMMFIERLIENGGKLKFLAVSVEEEERARDVRSRLKAMARNSPQLRISVRLSDPNNS